ncbi:MAG: hypothetical protein IJU72_00170 [Bacteroidales bacterium]|nr:hypothetical protein [Bacteroidales bacterium]
MSEPADDIAPNFDRQLPFRVPEGYFVHLAQRIEGQCVAPQGQTQRTPLSAMLRAQLALVAGFAALALLASMAYFYLQLPASPPIEAPLEVISRTIDYGQQEAMEQRRIRQRQLDSLNDFTRGKYMRYARNRSYSSISEEKWDGQPVPPLDR